MGDRRETIVTRAALTLAALALLYGTARLAVHAVAALEYPYGLDYGEGVVWQQMRGIVAGQGYAPLGLFPAFVYEYPPLYHLVVATTAPSFGWDELFAGRLVSLAMTIVSAALIAALTARMIGNDERNDTRVMASGFAALAFLTLPVLLTWSTLMRVDMLALALSLGGMLFSVRAVARPWEAVGAGIAFAAALYTKQTALPAPAAAFVVLLIARPRAAWILLAAALGSGLVALAFWESATGGQFLVHLLTYNMNRVVWDHARLLALVLIANVVTLALGAFGARIAATRLDLRHWRTMRARLADEPRFVGTAIILLALLLKTLMLPAILKSGASDNYLIDWLAPIAILIGLAVVPVIRAAQGLPASPSIALILLIGIGLLVQMLDPPFRPDPALVASRPELDRVAARIRASAKPVLGDEMVLILRGGQPVRWEPAIVAELGSAGLYDERAFAERIRRGAFGFFVTEGDRGSPLYDQRYNPVIADAIDAAYPRRERIGAVVLHLPR